MRGLQLAHRALPSSILQYRKHSTAQHSTAQHSTAQHSTAQRKPHQAAKSSTCRAECDNASKQTESIYVRRTVLQYRKNSTAQHSAISPHKAAKQVHTCRSECDNARKQAEFVEHLYSTLSSQNEQRYRNLPGLYNYHTHIALV